MWLTINIPVINVRCPSYSEGTTSVNQSGNGILVASTQERILVRLGCTSLGTRNETSTDPNTLSAPSQVGSKTPTIVNTTSTDHVDGLTSQGGFVTLAGIDTGGDEEGGGDITSVSSTFTSLGTDEVNTGFNGFGDVLGVANHLIFISGLVRFRPWKEWRAHRRVDAGLTFMTGMPAL